MYFKMLYTFISQSQWPHDLRRRSAAARLLRSWVRIPPGAWMFVCCECCVLSGRGLCDELITRPEEFYRLWCVVVCDLENLKTEEAMTRVGSQSPKKSSIDHPETSENIHKVSCTVLTEHHSLSLRPVCQRAVKYTFLQMQSITLACLF